MLTSKSIKIMPATEATKLANDSIKESEKELESHIKQFSEYIEKLIKERCKLGEFSLSISLSQPNTNKFELIAISKVVAELENSGYRIDDYSNITEKSPNGKTTITGKISWDHVAMR